MHSVLIYEYTVYMYKHPRPMQAEEVGGLIIHCGLIVRQDGDQSLLGLEGRDSSWFVLGQLSLSRCSPCQVPSPDSWRLRSEHHCVARCITTC